MYDPITSGVPPRRRGRLATGAGADALHHRGGASAAPDCSVSARIKDVPALGNRKSATAGRARAWLAAVWVGGFVTALGGAVGLYGIEYVETDRFHALVAQLSASYAVYVGVVLAFVFSSPKAPPPPRSHRRLAFALAMGPSLLWNTLVLGLLLRVYLQWAGVKSATEDIAFLGSTLSWIVAPGLGFYFARHEM